jgi:hypothetical protein
MSKLNVPDATAMKLAWLAAIAAVEAPERVSLHANDVRIPWSVINEIREALDEAGWNWRMAVRERVRLEKEARKAWAAKHYPQKTGVLYP